MSTLRVGLIFGGRSVEHEVSIASARSVAKALRSAGFDCVPLAVTRSGEFLGVQTSRGFLEGERSLVRPRSEDRARLLFQPGAGALLELDSGGRARPVALDVIFPLIHGWGGEDGRLQGAIELCGIPYVGCGVAASAVAMDKILARRLLDGAGIPAVSWLEVDSREYHAAPEPWQRRIVSALSFPIFVKPSNGGSSVGVSKVHDTDGIDAALARAFECDSRAIVEHGVDAREIECAVLGNAEPEASVLGEIVPAAEFYDYNAKYVDGTTDLRIPAQLDAGQEAEIRRQALAAYRALGLSGLSRVDFLLDRGDGAIYLNEINTLPGFTSISMFPALWEASGLAYPDLVRRLVDLALERSRAEVPREAAGGS